MRDASRASPGRPSILANGHGKSAADENDGNKQRQRTHGWRHARSPSRKIRRRIPPIPPPGQPEPRTLRPEQHCGPHECCAKRPRGWPRQDTHGVTQRPFLHPPPGLRTREDGANSGMGVRSDHRCPPPPLHSPPAPAPGRDGAHTGRAAFPYTHPHPHPATRPALRTPCVQLEEATWTTTDHAVAEHCSSKSRHGWDHAGPLPAPSSPTLCRKGTVLTAGKGVRPNHACPQSSAMGLVALGTRGADAMQRRAKRSSAEYTRIAGARGRPETSRGGCSAEPRHDDAQRGLRHRRQERAKHRIR